jgi:hypothetical protein
VQTSEGNVYEISRGHNLVTPLKIVLRHFYRCRYRSNSFLLEWDLVSLSLAMNEHGGHEDLHGSNRRSVILYIHRRTELYCSSLPYLSLHFHPPFMKRCMPEPFIAQGRTVTLRPGARQVAPMWLKPYTVSKVIMAMSSK